MELEETTGALNTVNRQVVSGAERFQGNLANGHDADLRVVFSTWDVQRDSVVSRSSCDLVVECQVG